MESVNQESSTKHIVIGVAGGTGSGKTTVSQAILDRVGIDQIAYLQHDSYYRDRSQVPPDERVKTNFDHPDALESELLAHHLASLKVGQAVQVPVYDFTTHTREARSVTVEPRKVILVEGILIFAEKTLRELMDIKVFVDTDADVRFIRRLQRDITERRRTMESVIRQYTETVRPMHLEFVEPSKRYADVIIPEGGFNLAAIDMLVAKVSAMIDAE